MRLIFHRLFGYWDVYPCYWNIECGRLNLKNDIQNVLDLNDLECSVMSLHFIPKMTVKDLETTYLKHMCDRMTNKVN